MQDFESYAKMILNNLDIAMAMVETGREQDSISGEIITPDRFSRGYALGYAHALSRAYEALPDWLHDICLDGKAAL